MNRIATGEMSRFDIQPDGEHYEWAETIRKAAREIQRRTKNALMFREMRPWDVYQGPYALTTLGKLWSTENEGEFFLDYGDGITGTPQEIAEMIRADTKKTSSFNRDLVSSELVAVAEMLTL